MSTLIGFLALSLLVNLILLYVLVALYRRYGEIETNLDEALDHLEDSGKAWSDLPDDDEFASIPVLWIAPDEGGGFSTATGVGRWDESSGGF